MQHQCTKFKQVVTALMCSAAGAEPVLSEHQRMGAQHPDPVCAGILLQGGADRGIVRAAPLREAHVIRRIAGPTLHLRCQQPPASAQRLVEGLTYSC